MSKWRKSRTIIWVERDIWHKLQLLKVKLRTKNLSKTIEFLIKKYEEESHE